MYYDTEDNKPPRSIFFIALLHHLRGSGSKFRWPSLHFLNREMRDEILHVRLHKRGHLHRCSILHGNLQQVLRLDRSENPHNCPVVLILNSHSFNAYQLLEAQFVDQTAGSQNPNRWRVRLRHNLELLSFLFGGLSNYKLGMLADASSTHQDHTSERWGLDVSPYRGGFYFHDGRWVQMERKLLHVHIRCWQRETGEVLDFASSQNSSHYFDSRLCSDDTK